MPEGDTIHRTAVSLDHVLTGRPLERAELPRLTLPPPNPGTVVLEVVARGKHLLIGFDDDSVLHTHLQMHGTWRISRRGEGVRRGGRGLMAALVTAGHVASCWDAPVVELLARDRLDRHPVLRELGPDLAVPGVDLTEVAARRARSRGDVPLVAALLDQRIAAGIGNVYASELAFHARTHPFTPISGVPAARLDTAWEQAAAWLQDNLSRNARTTVPDAPEGSLWVYGREGRPCRVCRTPVRVARQGEGARPAWWCPSCQPPPPSTTTTTAGTPR